MNKNDLIKINYSGFITISISLIFSFIFVVFVSISREKGGADIWMFGFLLVIGYILLNFLVLFLFPFLLRKPALILSSESIYINTIQQTIPWKEIKRIKINRTKVGYVITIFVYNQGEVFVCPASFVSEFVCERNILFYRTPFVFGTLTLQEKSTIVYSIIKNRAQLTSIN